jgi:hypothetical protein
MRANEHRPLEVCPKQVGLFEMGLDHGGSLEMCRSDIGPLQVRSV